MARAEPRQASPKRSLERQGAISAAGCCARSASAGSVAPRSTLAVEAIAQRPSNQLGLYNEAATSHRMGNTFGTSVYPQRPASPAPGAPVIPRAQP
ncbi:hypothetical protein DDK22_26295 [Cupriavidus necator]|uniref:Uncharacterized protein n=1 Tax=Cupriavidus necator TaxID=106590 RepID=A0A367PCA9_CUPNE|nr:hypothetical protein DDK22_26295 [Cupriavidus necator]